MAIFGGFMSILSIIGFFLTVIWFLVPFVIFSIKGKVDRSLELLEDIDRRLTALEARSHGPGQAAVPTDSEVAAITDPPV